jgi:UDP-N-acetylmuramoyl-tripeptide--D-alanyl-D-alanine ligase
MATPIPSNLASFSLAEIASITAGVLVGAGDPVRGVAIDSRAVTPGSLFVAIRGAQHDGASYLQQALERGAGALLVHAGTPCPAGTPRIEVADTTHALGELAAFHRRRWGKPVIAITGSAGKTTTKELTASALAATGARVHKTLGNLNNQIGAPMTLLGLGDEHDFAVLELGTSARGEIARLGAIAQPTVAAVLLAAAAHTEGIGTLSQVADEKASLFHALGEGGCCVVNADDAELLARVPAQRTTRAFGVAERADVRLLEARLSPQGTRVRASVKQVGELEWQLRLLGQAAALDACAALACVLCACGPAALPAAAAALAQLEPTPGRMAPRRMANGVVLLDDSYNSNPSSARASLETLKDLAQVSEARSIAVLGDMKELGALSQAEHARIGEFCVRQAIDVLVGCGPEMAHATSAAAKLSAGRLAPHPTRVAHVQDPLEATRLLRSLWRAGDVVLVKGSRSLAMERVVAALVAAEASAP